MANFQHDDLEGKTLKSTDGTKIGKVAAVYLDQETDKPEWISVSTGMFGSRETLVPLAAVEHDGDELVVPFGKSTIKDAPHQDPGTELSQQQEADLFRFYDVPYAGETVTSTGAPQTPEVATQASSARDVDGTNTDDAMTLSEERLRVGTETVESGKVRLRKYIVTENVTTTVPVSHEEARLEREPITDANRAQALAGEPIRESEYEVTLHEERPIVATETVPVERVRLATDTVTDEQEVTGTVRKEQIDTDGIDIKTV